VKNLGNTVYAYLTIDGLGRIFCQGNKYLDTVKRAPSVVNAALAARWFRSEGLPVPQYLVDLLGGIDKVSKLRPLKVVGEVRPIDLNVQTSAYRAAKAAAHCHIYLQSNPNYEYRVLWPLTPAPAKSYDGILFAGVMEESAKEWD